MVDAHQVKDRSVEVVDRHRLLHHSVAELVGPSDNLAGPDAAYVTGKVLQVDGGQIIAA